MIKRSLLLLLISFTLIIYIFPQSWKQYPYNPEGSDLSFPKDEAYHLKDNYTPYMNEYWYGWFDFYTDSGKHFPVIFCVFNGFNFFMDVLDTESSNYFSFENSATVTSWDSISFDHLRIDTNELKLFTKTDGSGNLIPFQYKLYMNFNNANISIDIDTTKRPLLDGGDGYLPIGDNQYAHYYSLTGLTGNGTLTLNGNTYHVSGNGWMEHVFGDFMWNFTYEWWTIKLNNGVDICFWNIFDFNNKINYGNEGFTPMTGYINDSQTFFTTNFNVKRTRYFLDKNGNIVATDWHLECDNPKISLDITRFKDVDQSMDSGLWEEYATVRGTFNGNYVEGCSINEHTHTYETPQVEITNPSSSNILSLPIKLKYNISNWDDGYNLKYKILISYDGSNFKEMAEDIEKNNYGLVPDEPINSFFVKVAAYSPNYVIYGESYPVHITTNGNFSCDFNQDGNIDSMDLGILLSHFGETSDTLDMDGDGKIDENDIETFERILYLQAMSKISSSKSNLPYKNFQ